MECLLSVPYIVRYKTETKTKNYLRRECPLLDPDCLNKRKSEGVFCMKSCSEEISEVVEKGSIVDNNEISAPIPSMGSRGHSWHCVATRTSQGGRGHSQESLNNQQLFCRRILVKLGPDLS